MRLIALALFGIATLAYADPNYQQAVTLAKADHAAVVARHCVPPKSKDEQAKCRREANQTLADVLAALKKKHGVK